jgi:ADP-ribose pyrophosphatase YjhB (NUDIX family)
MRKIYLEKRSIIICREDDAVLSDPNAIRFSLGREGGLTGMIEMFETSDTLQRIYIPTDDIEGTYSDVCREFLEVNAGGGLVENRRGDFLLINRNSLWDLPKGHQDPGEEISVTALREVQEETGIDKLELKELICITDHCYKRNDIWHLKHTWWYRMLDCKPIDLIPQREEDISKAAWVAKSSLPPFLQNTYPSIVEVFREAKV